jgi:hypothetical protein
MSLIMDSGGAGRTPVSIPTVTPAQQQPVSRNESDAAARQRELQRQIEAMLEQIREAQRRAEEARKRAIEAQKKAEQARKSAEEAAERAERTKAPADRAAARTSEQDSKLADAQLKKESANANLQDKEVALLRAQVAQKKEQKKSNDGTASAGTDQKLKEAQGERDGAARTHELSRLYASYQEKESKAQKAEAKAVDLTPAAGRPSATVSDKERTLLADAQAEATTLRADANAAGKKFTDAVGADASTEFYSSPPAPPSPLQPLLPQQTAQIGTDPLHSPLLQLLQVQSRPSLLSAGGPTLSSLSLTAQNSPLQAPTTFPQALNAPALGANGTSPTSPLDSLFQLKPTAVTPEVTQTLSSIADGKTVDQIAKERNIGADKVYAEANAAGIRIESSDPSTDVHVTTVRKGDAALSYINDYHSGSLSLNGSFADAKAPGGRKTVQAMQDGNGLLSQTAKDESTGNNVTHTIDVKAGTRTETVAGASGTRTETTTSLTGAPVLRPVGKYEDYLDVAKAANLTPEQLFALNPTVDYGKPLEAGQQLVVAGVPTTVKTYAADGSVLEKNIASDGTLKVVNTTADGHRVVLMGDPEPKTGPAEAARKAIFDDNKPIPEVAKSLNLSEEQLLALLPPGTVDVAKPTSDNGEVETRTLYDPGTNRTVIEYTDWKSGGSSRKVIDEKTVFKVHGYDDAGNPAIVEIPGGAGYAQKQADDKLALVGTYGKQIRELDDLLRDARHMGETLPDVQAQRRDLIAKRDTAQEQADIAQSKAASTLTKYKQTVIDKNTAIAYQRQSVARPGSEEQKAATADLNDMLARSDKIDRLVTAADKDVDFVTARVARDDAKDANQLANQNLQTEFEKWKRNWRWGGLDEKEIQKREAQGVQAPGPMYRNDEEENQAAWRDFKKAQKINGEIYGSSTTNGVNPSRDAWLNRNAASDAEQKAILDYDNASIAKGAADAHVIQGDVDRLQAKKNDWTKANPTLFSESFGEQKQLDTLTDQLANKKIGSLEAGEHKKLTEHLIDASAPDREEPESLKKLLEDYNNDNQQAAEEVDQQIKDLGLARTLRQSRAAEDYIAQWAVRNPALQRQLEAFEAPVGTGSVRAAEHRMDQKNAFLASSEQGQQLQKAREVKSRAKGELTALSESDVSRLQKDYDGVKKGQESHTWLRDIFDDSADEAVDYTKEQLDGVKKLKEQLASGEISLTQYAEDENKLMDAYGLKAVDIAQEQRENDEYWSVVDEAARIGVSTLAGIGATILSGGNVAVGFGVGLAVNELWDTAGDAVAAAQGRNIYADGHTSLLTLGYKVRNGDATWDDVKFTLKDEAVDIASAAVTPTGVGAGMRTTAALGAKLAARESAQFGSRTAFTIGERAAMVGNRAVIGARAGVTSQAVDGAGRVGIETMHVGLDGQLGTEQGDKRIQSAIASAALGVLTAPLTGSISAAVPLPTLTGGVLAKAGFGGALALQFGNDVMGSHGTGQLISLVNNGRWMNEGETRAAWIQAFPGTLNNIALHPHMAGKMAAAQAAQQARAQNAGAPANAANLGQAGGPGRPAVPGAHPAPAVAGGPQVHAPSAPAGGTGGVPRPVNVRTSNLPGLAGHDIDHLVVVNATSEDLSTGLGTHARAAEALAPGGMVEFRVALDTQKVLAASGDPNAPGAGARAKAGGKSSADEGGLTRKGEEDARQLKKHQQAQDNAIRVRLRGVGLDDIRITRNPKPGAKDPEIIVQATKPEFPKGPQNVFAKPAYDGYDQRQSYLTGDEMVAIYGSGTRPDPRALEAARNEARAGRRDMRVGVTARNRLNVGQVEPWLASPTMQSVSTGVGTRTNLRAIAQGAYYSFQLRSMDPLKNALGKELSIAVRPDEYRRTSMLQWGALPFSRDTIFTVFAKDLINIAKKEMFADGTPGYGVNMRSAKVLGPAADGSGQVVEVTLSVKLDGEHITLPAGQKDFLGGEAHNTPGDHVKVPSSLMFDRVIEDRRFAPFIPALKKALGYNGVFTASVERRWQMLLKDVIGAGDIVPARFFEQFQKTFADAKYKMQVVVPHADTARLHDPVAIAVRDFVARPDVAGLKALVANGHVDPGKALVFVPERGGNHHRTAVPGKPAQNELVDLTGKHRRVPHESTSNVWVIFADNKLERSFQRGVYRVKNFGYRMLPESAQRSRPSPHHVVGRGNLIDAMTGGKGRPDADGSLRLTAVFPMPKIFHAGLLAGSVEFRLQLGVEAKGVSRSVGKGGSSSVKVSPDGTAAVDVPNWVPRVFERSLTGSTPLIPTGGTKQLGKFFDDLQSHLDPAESAAVAALREKYMSGDKPVIGDARFLRAHVAQDIVKVLTGLQPGNGGKPPALVAGPRPEEALPMAPAAAARPSGLRRADLNYVDGEVTVQGQPVRASDIELAVPADSILIIANRANPPGAERIAADVRAAGHPEGKDVVLYLCDAGTPARPDAPVPASLARDLSNRLGARVHAVDGDVVLGEQIVLGGQPITQRPNLPLTDVSRNTAHRATDADFDAQKRFWLEPGGRPQGADAPLSPEVRAKGAWVGDKAIDPLHLGIEDRVVDMRPMNAENAQEIFPLLVKELGVSPEYNALGAQGMIDKWLGEIAAGTRYARVIYPAPGSTPASDAPIGLISVHKEALIGDSYRNTLPAALYRGSKPAGETSKEALQARGEVWQFSTYLGSNKNRYPGGVINKAARMQFMSDVMRQEAAKGAPVEAFYSRVSGGAPFVTDSNGVTIELKGHKFNVASSFSQESQTVGRGPIAVGYEDSSPFKSPDYPDGEPARHIYIYETDASFYGPEGKGTLKWRSKIEQAFDGVPGSRSLLAPMRPADLNYLEGDAAVNGRAVPAREIELAVPPDSILVMAERGNPPSAERIAADLRAGGHPAGKDVVLYLCEGGTPARADVPVPESLARELSNKLGARVHAVDGDIVLAARNTVEGSTVVQRPNLPLTDVSQNAPHRASDVDFDAQRRFWLEPGGRTQQAEAPFSQKVLDKGATVGDKSIDPLHLGIEERAVELVPFDAQHARDVLPYLAKELEFSPDYMRLKADGMAQKWIDEINAGKRMAFVIYPPPGSAARRQPLGIIAVHKEALIGDNYIATRDPAHYNGAAPAGALGKQELLDLGEVWQFSTYLSEDRSSMRNGKSPFPGGVVNSAAKKQVMDFALAELARRGEPINAFYARVHAGAPEAVPELGWKQTVNAKSLGSQERMAGGGPVAVVHEQGPRMADGKTPTRYVAIFETPVGLYAEDGAGTAAYRSLIDIQIGKYPAQRWLGPEEWQRQPLVHRPADLNYLEGNATVNGRPVRARDIEVAVPEKAFVVMADEARLPGLDRIAADMRAAGYPEGQDVALYICRAGELVDRQAAVPQSLALQLGEKLGARVHAVEGTITLGEKIELGKGDFVTATPQLPLIDVSTGRPHTGENFETRQRFWLAPNGRGERVDAPLGAEVRNKGARAGEGGWIDPYLLGIEEQGAPSRAASPEPVPQGVRAIDPDSVARQRYDMLARELGLTDSQADAMRGWTLAHRDAVTGFYDARLSNLKADTVSRAQARVAESGEDAYYVSAHLANLGGLNAAMNNVADAANVHFRGLTDILAGQLDATGGTVVPMRTGGKELGVAVVGVDEPTLAHAVDATQRQVAQYAQDHGLADIPHPKHAEESGVGLRIGYTLVSPDKTLNHIFTEADQGVRRSNQHVTTDTGRTAGADRPESGATQATPAAIAAAGRRGAPAGEDGAGGATRGAAQPDDTQGVTAASLPTRYATNAHDHARIDPEAARLREFADAARAAGLDSRQFTGLLQYGHAPRDSVTGFYDARQSGVKAETVRRLQDHVANSDDNGFYVSADIANLSGLNQAMQSRGGKSNAHFRAMASLFADALASTGATVIPLRTGGDELAAAVVGQVDEAGLRTALDAAGQRIAHYTREQGLADIPHPKRKGEKGVGMHMGYAEALPGRTLDGIFTEADLGVDASKNAARVSGLRVDLEGGVPVTLRTSDGEQLSAQRLTVIESDGTRRPMTGAEVLDMAGRDMLGHGSSADVYPFGEGQVIKIYRNSRAPDPDQSHLLIDLPDGATVHPRMAAAAREVTAVRELRGAAGEWTFVDVKGPFLVGDRLALVMPRHPFAGKRLELDLQTRTYSGEGSELLNERTARSAGALADRLNAVDKFPADPQHLANPDGSVIGFDPLEVSSGELARNYHEGEALKLARTGRQNAAQRPAPDRPEGGKVQFVAGPAPGRVLDAGGLELPGPDGVHATVAGAKWAAIEPMPAPFDRDGSESAAYVYATDANSVQVAADGSHTIPLEAILAGRQVDAFGRFIPDETVRFRAAGDASGNRRMPEGLIDLSKLGQKKEGPGRATGTST